MRKIEIDYDLIEYIKEILKEVDANDDIPFKKYWKSLSTIQDKVKAILTIPNYYYKDDPDLIPIEDFYELRNIKFDDNAIYFEINEYANIFLRKLYYYSDSEILRIERKEKLSKLNIL